MQVSSIKFNCYNQTFRTYHFTRLHPNIQRKKNSLELYRTFAASIMHWEKVKAGKFQDQTASKLSTWTESQKCKISAKKSGSKRLQIITWIGSQNDLLYTLVTSRHHQRARDKQTKKQKGNYINKSFVLNLKKKCKILS